MESEKVKEIKKALEYAIDMGLVIGKNTMFANIKLADILTLINELEECSKKWQKLCADEVALNKPLKERINELESENKELKRYKLDWLNSEKMHLQADMEDTEFELFCANKSLDKVRAENKKLKDRIVELEKEIEENAFYSKGYAQGIKNTYEVVIPEKLKRFAEMLKENDKIKVIFNDGWMFSYVEICKAIDETLKECIND